MEKRVLLLVLALVAVIHAALLPSREAFDKQVKLYNELMGDFVGGLQRSRVTLGNRGEFELYRVGRNDMELKTVFDLLQNWYHHIEERANEDTESYPAESKARRDFIEKQRYFELNIGGKDYKFGIQLVEKTKEILIVGEDGKAPPYSELYRSFSNSGHEMQTIAKHLLKAADSPVSSQPDWTETITNAKVRDHMRMFSVISQIAEGARSSENFFMDIQTASKELLATRVASLDDVDAVLKKNMYEPISSIVKSDEYNVETYSQYRDFISVIEQAQVLVGTIKIRKSTVRPPSEENIAGEESPIPPDRREEFFKKLRSGELNLDGGNKVIADFLLKYGLAYKGKIKDFKKAARKIKTPPEGQTNDELEKAVENRLTRAERRPKEKKAKKIQEPEEFVALNREITDKILNTLKITKHNDEFFERLTSLDLEDNTNLKSFLEKLNFETSGENFDNLVAAIQKLKEEKSNPESTASQEALRQAVEDALPPVSNRFCERLSTAARQSHKKLREETFKYYDKEVLPEVEGRIPGAGDLVRHLLKQLETGKISSFEDVSRISLFMEVKGLIPSRIQAIEQSSFTQDQIRVAYDNAIESLHLKTSAVLESMQETATELVGACSNAPLTEKYLDCKRSLLMHEELCEQQADESCRINDDEELVEDSLKWKGDQLEFETIDKRGVKELHERTIPLEENELSRYLHEEIVTKGHLTKKFGIGVGVYGTFVAIVSSIKQFEDGNYGQGALSAVQALHSLGGLTGLNEKIGRKLIQKSLDFAAEKFASAKILEKLSEPLAEGLGKAGKVFSRFLGDIPFVGLGFDIYFIAEDIKDLADRKSKTPLFLKVAHLILDVTTTILSLVETFVPEAEPFIEPIIIALTIIRITIDDFYTDIKSELDKVKGKSFGVKVVAFFKGFAEGVADVFTLGLVTQLNQLNDAIERDRELFTKMKNPENYFNETLAAEGKVDLNSGSTSQYGGFISVTLNDDGSFTMELPEVYVGETPRKVERTFRFNTPAKDIILGLGTTVSPQYIHQTAKLWLLIPIKSADIVSSFLAHNSSHYGTYYGNKYNNNFFAVQQANISSDYHYNLHGRDGDDKFFLGPQTTFVLGGEGQDIFFIPSTGGETTIDNFALDEKIDTLYMNISYRELSCSRVDSDLVIVNNATTSVILNRWFLQGDRHEYFRHITITTKDGIEIDATSTKVYDDEHQTICNVVSINEARSKRERTIDLRDSTFAETKHVVGSNFSDTIFGNEMDNLLVGGLGNDIISGGNGSDKYLFKAGDGVDTINNYATDRKMDTILFGVNYVNISVERQGANLTLVDSTAPQETKLIMQSWFTNQQYQHANFISKDYIIFLVTNDDNIIRKDAITIDLSMSETGVTVNLQNQTLNRGIQLNTEVMHDVKVLFDSPYDDRLVGNLRNNIISCSGGTDYLQGNAGSDTYMIKQSCNGVTISNYDNLGKPQYDLLLFNCESSNIEMSVSGSDLRMACSSSSSPDVVVKNWFNSSLYQHLQVKTQDKWTFLPPENKEGFSSIVEPYQIGITKTCNGERQTFDLNTAQFQQVQRITANSSLCEFNIIGNSLNNYFDLGPSNSYGYRTLEGGNGSDTYVFGYSYGVNNRINNYAPDGQYDHLLFDVIYEYIEVAQFENDILVLSTLANNTVSVNLLNFLNGSSYQHLLIHSSDGKIFQIKMVNYSPIKQIAMVSYSKSTFSQIINVPDDESLKNVREIIGSQVASNIIHGGRESVKITGGNNNDTIIGGAFIRGEDINGKGGDDYIDGREGDDNISGGDGNDILIGGTGNDVIYGGKGADTIRGGNGSDTVVFSGSGKTKTGVLVNLQSGTGFYADAHGDTYKHIENILGSEYNDSLIGNDDNNFINGYAGEDYIIPAGGSDNLKGGLDSDIYDMKNAFGLKIINNFATDKQIDTLILSEVSRQQMCYFYTGDDLYININYGSNRDRGAMGRALLGEAQLQIKLASWLSNSTYQHLQIIFSDRSVLNGANLSENGRQMSGAVNEMLNKTNGIQIASENETTVVLNYNVQFINERNPLPNDTELIWVHSGFNKLQRHPVNIDSSADSVTLTVTDLKQGVKQLFYITLMSCNVTVAVSPLQIVTTPPNPPVNITIYPVISGFDGFTVHWLPPNESTDPNAFYYNYTIKYWKRDNPGEIQVIEHNDFLFRNFTAFNLTRNTYYELTIASKVDNTTGRFSPPVTIHSGYTSCLNFFGLSDNSHIRNVENRNGTLFGILYCDPGYELRGSNEVECNETSSPSQQCDLLHCDLPSEDSVNAVNVTGNASPVEGDNVIWQCSDRTRTASDGKYFSSSCVQGIWNPPLRPCIREPACSTYPNISHGNVNPPFAYVNETITFSCLGDYTRRGPERKVCISNSNSGGNHGQPILSYSPTTPVECVRLPCPQLLQQPHGRYTVTNEGNVANLICNNGYFVSTTDNNNPERQTLRCTREGTWNVRQRSCQPMLEAVRNTRTRRIIRSRTVGSVRFTVPQWRSRSRLPNHLNQVACDLLGLGRFIHKRGLAVECRMNFRLSDNPPLDNGNINRYRGKLTLVHGALGTSEKICVEYDRLAYLLFTHFWRRLVHPSKICRWLGLGNFRYSTISVTPYRTTKVVRLDAASNRVLLRDEPRMCSKIISCRQTCEPLRLDSAINRCDKTLEGESCSFRCQPGSSLLGTPTRTCQRSGTWSGDNNNCDAERWKADIDRIGRNHGSSGNLHNILYDHLTRTYPGVSWLVMVYSPVGGYDKHTMRYFPNNVYLKFRHYGNNIVVGRILSSPSRYNYELPLKLRNAISPYLVYFPDMKPLAFNTWDKIRDDNQSTNVRLIYAFRKELLFLTRYRFKFRSTPDTRIHVRRISLGRHGRLGKIIAAVIAEPYYG